MNVACGASIIYFLWKWRKNQPNLDQGIPILTQEVIQGSVPELFQFQVGLEILLPWFKISADSESTRPLSLPSEAE